MIRHYTLFCLLALLVMVGAAAPLAHAQEYTIDIKPARGFMPNADQVSSPIDSVDPVSGKLHTSIPLASLPRGRAGHSFELTLEYDSRRYDITPGLQDFQVSQTPLQIETETVLMLQAAGSTGGWTYNFKNIRLDLESRPFPLEGCAGPHRVYKLRVGLADGSQHVLHLKDKGDGYTGGGYLDDAYQGDNAGYFGISPDGRWPTSWNCWQPQNGRLTYYTTDGSFLKVEIDADGSDWTKKTWSIYFPDGRIAEGRGYQLEKLRDANGNTIIFENILSEGKAQSTRIYHEEDGRESDRAIIILYNLADTISGPGPNGRMTWTVNRELLTIGGAGSNRKYSYRTSSSSLTYPDAAYTELTQWISVVTHVQLPFLPAVDTNIPVWNSYAFQYSGNLQCGFGELKSIRTPSNATYTYDYALEHASNCSDYKEPTSDIVNSNKVVRRVVSGPGLQPLTTQYAYGVGGAASEVTGPDLGKTIYWHGAPFSGSLVYRIDRPNGSVTKRVWAQNKSYDILDPSINDPKNIFVQKETVTVGDINGAPAKTAVTEYSVDKNGNPLQQIEYDWVNYEGAGIESGSVIKRITTFGYWSPAPNSTDVSSTLGSNSAVYWTPHTTSNVPPAPRRINALKRRVVWVEAATHAVSEFTYDNPYTKGNLTEEYRWNNFPDLSTVVALGSLTSGNSQVLTRSYDSYGNLAYINAPEVPTHITMDGLGHFPSRVEYDYAGSARRTWDYAWNTDGSLLSKTDVDNGTVSSFEYDVVGRQRTATDAARTGNLRKAETIYDDLVSDEHPNRKITTKRDLSTFGDGLLQSATHYDALGRVVLNQSSEGPLTSDTAGTKVATSYTVFTNGSNPGGRRVITSSPYRSTTDATLEWNCTQVDLLGRVTHASMFTGSAAPTDCTSTTLRTALTGTAYNADVITITDPALKVRTETRDALGRLIAVGEDPNGLLDYTTSYTYDPLDNLVKVVQGNLPDRLFKYSSLGWLKEATNPESGTIRYTYTPSGNLATRSDDRPGISTSFVYDGLQRLHIKDYSDATPDVEYNYHTAGACRIGQLASVSTDVSLTAYTGYDCLGRVTGSTQTMPPNSLTSYPFGYTWRLNDSLKTMSYPSGKVLNYDVDNAGRGSKVSTTSKTYGDLAAYTPSGQIAKVKLGNDLWDTREFRTPGTATKFRLGTSDDPDDKLLELEYNFSGTANNGNVLSHVIRKPNLSPWTQTFTYDGVNRLLTASEAGGFNRGYGYDPYGNRWVTLSSGLSTTDIHEPTVESNFSTWNNNRLGVHDSAYDEAGNQKVYTPYTLAYDAENRNTTMTSPMNGAGSFAYDGDGRRVVKTWTLYGGSPVTTSYVYDALGRLAAEYSTQVVTAGTFWNFSDMLGSVRAVTGDKPPGGTASITECYDYEPFGRLLGAGDNNRTAAGCYPPISSQLPQKFTGKERDAETNLDFFGARYYSAAQGRFSSPDPLLNSGRPELPQSWNRYAYVLGNPLKYNDPTGLYEWDATLGGAFDDSELKRRAGRDKRLRAEANSIIAQRKAIREQLKKLGKAKDPLLTVVAAAIGTQYDPNGVTLAMQPLAGIAAAVNIANPMVLNANGNPVLRLILSPGATGEALFTDLAHEGTHVVDAQAVARGNPAFMRHIETEMHAYMTQVAAARALGWNGMQLPDGTVLWNSSWSKVDQQTRTPVEIMKFLMNSPVYKANLSSIGLRKE